MTLFPMFVKLEGRSCLVVGAGSVGEPKIGGLLASEASVRVIAPKASATVAEWAQAGAIIWEAREFQSSDLDGVFLVIVATSFRDVNESIFLEARRRNILCNVVDDPKHCASTMERFLAAPGPALLEAVVDPFEPPLPAKVKADQALKFAESLARGEPNRGKIALTVASDKVRELV